MPRSEGTAVDRSRPSSTAPSYYLGSLFEPRSIALLGASADDRRFGGISLRNLLLHGFEGELFPVNPKYHEVRGLRCYANVLDIPSRVDAAILTLPPEAVVPALRECAAKEVALAVVVTSGFAEGAGAHKAEQQTMTDLARASGMRILGPNCLGFLNAPSHIAASAGAALNVPELAAGGISLVSHSGALGFSSVFARANDRGISFRYVVSSGNECDLNASDVLNHFASDPETRVIAALLEGIRDPAGFRHAAAAAAASAKPMVVLKTGRSEKGRQAAIAHTASLAGSDDVHDAVFRHHGVVRVDDVDDLWEVSSLFDAVQLPAGRRVGVLTTTGGLNGLLADHLQREGLELPDFSEATQAGLGHFLPYFSSKENPLDLTAFFAGTPSEAEVFQRTLALLDADDGIDIIVLAFVVMRQQFDDVLIPVIESIRRCGKPVIVLSTGGNMSDTALRSLRTSRIPLFGLPSRCARALRHVCDYADFQRKLRARPLASRARRPRGSPPAYPAGLLGPDVARELLGCYGVPAPPQEVARGIEEAERAAARIGYPVVLKSLVSGLVHKSDAGGVVLGIKDRDELKRAFARLTVGSGATSVLVQALVQDGVEMIVGLHRDAQFGPVVLLGSGGIFVELIRDSALLLPPLDRSEVLATLQELRSWELLQGPRGRPAADVQSLVDVVLGVSRLAEDFGEHIDAIDLNPVLVLPAGHGCSVVDERVFWREISGPSGLSPSRPVAPESS